MSVIAIVWAAVMITFFVVTLGGFVRRRFRTLIELEKENKDFLGKLALRLIERGAVLRYYFGIPYYDRWVKYTFAIYRRIKYVRQTSLLLGFIRGLIEVGFKAQNIIDSNFHYNLWPFRIFMILIFTPLILYSPFLELQFRGKFNSVEDVHQGPSTVAGRTA